MLSMYSQNEHTYFLQYAFTTNYEGDETVDIATMYVQDQFSVYIWGKVSSDTAYKFDEQLLTFSLELGDDEGQMICKDGIKGEMKSREFLLNKVYYVKESIPHLDWKILHRSKVIQGLSCREASCNFRGRTYYVWFTQDIPIQNGPWKLGGLPGLIIEAHDELNEIKFSLQSFKRITQDSFPQYCNFDNLISWDRYKDLMRKKYINFTKYLESSAEPGVDINTKLYFIEKSILENEN